MNTRTTAELLRRPLSYPAPARRLQPHRHFRAPELEAQARAPARNGHEWHDGHTGHNFAPLAVRAADSDQLVLENVG